MQHSAHFFKSPYMHVAVGLHPNGNRNSMKFCSRFLVNSCHLDHLQELGVQPPVGFWDPLGLSKDGDVEASAVTSESLWAELSRNWGSSPSSQQ